MKTRRSSALIILAFIFATAVGAGVPSGYAAQATDDGLTGQKAGEVFGALVGPEFLNAEQDLVEKIPSGSDILNTIGKALPFKNSFTNNGALPTVYTPSEGNVFRLLSIMIPEDDFSVTAESSTGSPTIDSLKVKAPDGKTLVPFFIHPNELDHYSSLIAKYPQSPKQWIATPTSSARSLLVTDPTGQHPPFVVKASLSVQMGGANRLIDDERVARAVKVNDLVDAIHTKTDGKLRDSDKSWDFFHETYSALPADQKLGGYIVRELPAGMSQDIVLPIFSLISDRSPKPRWIDELYQKSGRSSMAEFIWEDIVKPEIDLHATFMENGLTSEFHQQNVMLRIDRNTGKIKGLVLRDMDSNWVDHSVRTHLLGMKPVDYLDFKQDAYLFRYALATENHFNSYVHILRDSNIESTFKYVLNKNDMKDLLRKSDAYMLSRFNKAFPNFRINSMADYRKAWQRIGRAAVTPDEQKIYNEIISSNGSSLKYFLKSLYIMRLNRKLREKKPLLTRVQCFLQQLNGLSPASIEPQ